MIMVVLRPDFSKHSSQCQIPANILSQLRQNPWCTSILEAPPYIGATLEDGNGTVFTTAEALFLEVERKPRPKI
jgi:hypothetical protein